MVRRIREFEGFRRLYHTNSREMFFLRCVYKGRKGKSKINLRDVTARSRLITPRVVTYSCGTVGDRRGTVGVTS